MQQGYRVTFTALLQAALEPFELDEELGNGQVLVRTVYSIISAGTEGSHYSGLEAEHPGLGNYPFTYPMQTGYGNYGEIIALGENCGDLRVGDRVLSFSNHASHVKVDAQRFCLKAPSELDGKKSVFTRMAGVAITALRSASVSPGDKVIVIGLGLVGNFAAQLFRLAGAEVMGVDLSDFRIQVAEQCGIANAVNPGTAQTEQAVMDWTDGSGADISVEAIGKSELIAQAVRMTRRKGEVILLGSPRARVSMDVTPMLSRIHLQGIRMIGALEWLYSITETDVSRHNITRNYQQILGWIASDDLKTEPLLTHLLSPKACQDAYLGLHERKDAYLGVVFDWNQL
jgi:2-desacetyl-2-hydroxyethyl bacteriochlorophyllide A dehydrogenase